MYIRFPEGKMKAVTLSYDDGVVEDIRLSEILKQNGIKCTFNINTGYYLGEEEKREIWKGRLKRSEAIALYKDSGNEVAVQTLTHPQIADLSTAEMVTEVIHPIGRSLYCETYTCVDGSCRIWFVRTL